MPVILFVDVIRSINYGNIITAKDIRFRTIETLFGTLPGIAVRGNTDSSQCINILFGCNRRCNGR